MIFIYNPKHSLFYVIPQQPVWNPTAILFVRQGDTLPQGKLLNYEGRELPLDTPIAFQPTHPFPAYLHARQYRIYHDKVIRPLTLQFKKGEQPKSYLSSVIALVVHTGWHADINAARFLTKARESDFDHCREPGVNDAETDLRRVTSLQTAGGKLNVGGLPITPTDFVFILHPTVKTMYVFPIADRVSPIVLLLEPNQYLPPGRILGCDVSDLPRNVRLPFVPKAPIRAFLVHYYSKEHARHKAPSFILYNEDTTAEIPQCYTSREISVIIRD